MLAHRDRYSGFYCIFEQIVVDEGGAGAVDKGSAINQAR
jgi:hypothetical protein